MSLKDGTKKMSKSESSDSSRINLTDTPEVIYDKIKKAKTDSISTVISSRFQLFLNTIKGTFCMNNFSC